ncbi:MAG: hypothetical protein HYV06_04380 [Deltaproteobacteria bacterium]|nr:hypothetical protein [Deltaproteobacteria bacterium]
MQHAATSQTADDLLAAWQAEHVVIWCHRLSATISHAVCEDNQRLSAGDLRCHGCSGLDNQAEARPVRPALAIVWDAGKDPAEATDNRIEGLDTLDEVIDGLYEKPSPGDDFDDVELDLDDEELLKLFPELAGGDEDIEPDYPRFTEYQTTAPRRAVYRGRCKRCGGYMEDTREHQDDNVFRCLACGWRTGPEYVRNRAIHASGGMQ